MRKPNEDTLLDLAVVKEAIRLVGTLHLTFTFEDIRREVKGTSRWQLAHPGRVSNYVNKQVGSLIAEVDPTRVGGLPGPRRFVLLARQRQLERGLVDVPMRDGERTLVALWLAFDIEGESVTTRQVTAVMAGISALNPTGLEYPTYSRLENLARLSPPRAERSNPSGERWVRWAPIGEKPQVPGLDAWREQASSLLAGDPVRSTGRATRSGVVVDLVAVAVQKTHRSWPHGRPVRMSDIQAAAATPEGRAMGEAILAAGELTLAAAVADTARRQIGGAARRQVLLDRTTEPVTGSTFYDVPALPGTATRKKYVDWVTLRNAGKDPELDRIVEEVSRASQIVSSTHQTSAAIGAARMRLGLRELEELDRLAQGLVQIASDLPGPTRASLLNRHALIRGRLEHLRRLVPAQGLEQRIVPVVDPQAALDAPRPLCGPQAVQNLLPKSMLGGKDPGQFLRDIVGLRRFTNPDYSGPADPNPTRRVRRMVDRVELITYLSTRFRSPMTPWLEASARMLGRNLRCMKLAAVMADDSVPEHASRGLAWLALLGAGDAVEERAYEIIEDRSKEPEVVQAALWALLLVQRLEHERLRESLMGTVSEHVILMAKRAAMAANHGRWLLPS